MDVEMCVVQKTLRVWAVEDNNNKKKLLISYFTLFAFLLIRL